MHELSLATEVISLVTREAEKHRVTEIREVMIEVGDLSGVEVEAFGLALELIVRGTLLEQAKMNLVQKPGKGRCNTCKSEFEMKHLTDGCPQCGSFPAEITGGREFRVVSMVTGD
jgi:hydrogenase nickel incorporation protein HypA/HybF